MRDFVKAKHKEYQKADVSIVYVVLAQFLHVPFCPSETETEGSSRSSAQAGRDKQAAGGSGAS